LERDILWTLWRGKEAEGSLPMEASHQLFED
jgi:hypothetical protein